jgi:5-dehydro-2-deoxygluconokinase
VIEVVVIGRVGTDFPPDRPGVALSGVASFTRDPGGYGGNVGTGLARLGVRTAVVATLGDDGHGRFVRDHLAREGVEVDSLWLDPNHRTPLAFYEAWPPDHFPVTFYPSQAYWALAPEQLGPEHLAAPVVLASATSLARGPSRDVVLRFLEARAAAAAEAPGNRTVLDLDWRPMLWDSPAEMPALMARAKALADIVIGSEAEFGAVGMSPEAVAARPGSVVYLKRGELGARYLDGERMIDIEPIRVETVCGIGSGDAFAAAVGEGLLRGRDPAEIIRRANAAGAIVATRLTCSAAMPTNDEIEALRAACAPAARPSTAGAPSLTEEQR